LFNEKIKNIKDVNFIYVNDFKEEAKQKFNININESTLGYYYTIQYFVSLLKTNQPFLFNVSSDCDVFFEDDYFIESIKVMKENSRIVASTLPWYQTGNAGEHEQERTIKMFNEKFEDFDKFHYSYFFSDQVFLADVEKMKKINFNTNHPESDFFPAYGGNCFEKRICSYFLTEKKFRIIYKKHHYIHKTN
jgi:hypothetical protein